MNDDRDIAFRRKEEWFRFRACGIIQHEGKVLMATSNKIGFYYAVGGGVMHNETAEEAVLREVCEETGVAMEIDHLAFIHQNFFPGLAFKFGHPLHCHELAFYYLMKYEPDMPIDLGEKVNDDGSIEHLEWIPLERYLEYEAYPTFFAEKLPKTDKDLEMIVSRVAFEE